MVTRSTASFNNADLRSALLKETCIAAKNGNLEILKSLTDKFQLTIDDICADDGRVLRLAAGNGHLDLMKWYWN